MDESRDHRCMPEDRAAITDYMRRRWAAR
jgi:hypothetical protein